MTRVMGVLNVTPDSFSDGGRYDGLASAVEHAKRMADEGAHIIDVGGESTRPGAAPVEPDTEIARTAPVVEAIASLGPRISIDTRKAVVAKAAVDAGATIVNDVSGGSYDPELLPLVADRGVDVILMHMRGTPETMDSLTDYGDVVADVRDELAQRLASADDPERVWLDPGLGFAKNAQQSLELCKRIDELRALGRPLVVGPSRKRFVGHALGGAPVDDRLEGTLAVVAWLASHDVDVVRVHDVREARRVVDVIGAIRS